MFIINIYTPKISFMLKGELQTYNLYTFNYTVNYYYYYYIGVKML